MHNRFPTMVGLAATGLLIASCSNDNVPTDTADANADLSGDSPVRLAGDSSPDQSLGLDAGLGCCPAGFLLYQCQRPEDGDGLACHNPAMGCASSSTCGEGCDPEVTGRCQCVETQLCVAGDHFDTALCKCVPNADAGAPAVDSGKSTPDACIDNVLCVRGDHFDATLCRCVPNLDAGGPAVDSGKSKPDACIDNVLCIRGDHFDTTLCRCVPDADSGVSTPDAGNLAHDAPACVDNVLCIMGDHFDNILCRCVPDSAPSGCLAASDCDGALPAVCQLCSDGTYGCAHFACVAGKCSIAYCP
jgi:hypothetical protein